MIRSGRLRHNLQKMPEPITAAGTSSPLAALRRRICAVAGRTLTLLAGSLLLLWPAFYNGFPLLYPDSMTYLGDGPTVARAVFLHQFAGYYGMRSLLYSLMILPFHWNRTAWPVVFLQSFLAAWVLWLVTRCFARQNFLITYLALMIFLGAATSIGWYSSLVMPDILGPLAYLGLSLLAFARDSLARRERIALLLLAFCAITAHATHLLLAAALCLLFLAMGLFAGRRFPGCLRTAAQTAALLALAAGAQLALNLYLYGEPSLNGERPPFLTARLIADGPGRWYLEKNCAHLSWAICAHVRNLPDDPDNFLWGDDGIYQNSTDEENKRMVQEEFSFAAATVAAYPRAQLSRSAANFWGQLQIFGLFDLDPSSWVLDQFASVLPDARTSYLRSRQVRNHLPLEGFTNLQRWTVFASLAALCILIPWLARRSSCKLVGFGCAILSMVVINALVTGTLSMVEDRFECRVIWMVPLLAALAVLDLCSAQERTHHITFIYRGIHKFQ